MLKNELKSVSTVCSETSDGVTVTKKTEHVEIKTQVCEEEEKSVLEVHGGSISERLAALQRSGSENWKKRIGGKPPILLKPDGPVMRVRDKPAGERPHSLLDRIMMLGEAQDHWRSRVEDKDASQFTVAGKMVQMQYSPHSSPVISRKKYSPKPVQSRSKTTNIQELSSYISQSVPSSPYHLSKSQSSLITCSSSSELEKIVKTNTVSVPKLDDEGFTSFFKSVKNRINRISKSSIDISDEVFEFLSSETHELLNQRREKLKLQRKHAASGNPLRVLASRSDLKQDYEEIYRGVAERELERMKIEKLAKGSSLAMSALAGLASTEDFKNVALKKSTSIDTLYQECLYLLQIKGRRRAQVRLVEPKVASLNHGDSYVLVTPNQVYCWHGEFSNVIERVKASEVASLVQSCKDLGFKGQSEVMVIEEESSSHASMQEEFFKALAVKFEDVRAAGAPDEDELYEIAIVNTNAVYKLEDNELKPCDEFCGVVPKIEMLKSDMIYVFDFGAEMYTWCGKLASTELRKTATALAKELWDGGYNYSECDINPLNALFDGPLKSQDAKRPEWTIFMKTSQHREPVLFKEKFFDWPNIHPLISQKNHGDNKNGKVPPACISDLKPCDPSSILNCEAEEPDMMLENSHLGRGLEYHDEVERRHFRITSVSHRMWHVQEHGYEPMPEESWGQFHNGDTYVIRWQYMISSTGRTLKGGTSRYSFVGRKRLVYFFWQGEKSPITEKGASALMTIELNEEKGPHVRVICGKEPPCFLNLFRGQMVVYDTRRAEKLSNDDEWKMFMLRGDMKTEAVLQEVKLSKSSLRSRTSFLIANRQTGKIFIWHGCKSAAHSRENILNSAHLFVENSPLEMDFDNDARLKITEVEEGSEPEEFWDWSEEDEDDQEHHSLLKSDVSYDFTPRLFLIDSMSGSMCAKEIVCPYFTTTHSCPFPLLQSDLKKASQPALFLLDNHHEVFVWQGWLPSDDPDSENSITGSAKLRWEISRRLVMETALQYCQGKNCEESPKAFAIHAGHEPLNFTNIFPQWNEWDVKSSLNEEEGKVVFVQEVLSQLSRDRYSLEELQRKPRPPGVDLLRLESYLTDQEFQDVLGMKKDEFYNMPSWKQSDLKKANGLF